MSNAEDDDDLPEKYDLRNIGGKSYVTPVKNQGEFGTCWAHSALSCTETRAMLKGNPSDIDLSEKALTWFAFQHQGPREATDDELEGVMSLKFNFDDENYSDDDMFSSLYYNGGSFVKSINQMSTWLGAASEEDIPYKNATGEMEDINGELVPSTKGDWSLDYYDIYDSVYHLQNAETIWGPSNLTVEVEDYLPKAKRLMLKYGSLKLEYHSTPEYSSYFNSDTSAQYIPPDTVIDTNYGVTVVGWDDNYSKTNFKEQPPGDGAWIVKNSWGPNWGDNGYFYLSYYDSTIEILTGYDVETDEVGYSYNRNYQYDYMGDKSGLADTMMIDWLMNQDTEEIEAMTPGQFAYANVFTAQGDEFLKAVSAYTVLYNTKVTAKVYLLDEGFKNPEDGKLVATVTSDFENRGFHTMKLSKPIKLAKGQKFSIVENAVNTYKDDAGNTITYPMLVLEYGFDTPSINDLVDDEGTTIGVATNYYRATVKPGESFVYGASSKPSQPSHAWTDVTDSETYEILSKPLCSIVNGHESIRYLQPGNCMIKAFTVDSNTASPKIGVKGVTLKNIPGVLGVGQPHWIKAVISPFNASNQSVKWSSSNTKVAEVDSYGTIKPMGKGKTRIMAITEDGRKWASCVVTVGTPVADLKLNESETGVVAGQKVRIKATVSPANATLKGIVWKSSNTKVATVSSNGTVTGIKDGKVTITATTKDGDKKATCKVTVSKAEVKAKSLKIDGIPKTLNLGKTYYLTAKFTPGNVTDKSLTWSSSNPRVVAVNKTTGKVTAKKVGTATITATTKDKKLITSVKVNVRVLD